MESLSETPWDITISGTGLAQSLLALALSRSGKKVLHVDRNPYYGGPEAAFSLQDAQEWVSQVSQEPGKSCFEDVTLETPPTASDCDAKLASSRAYTLSLSPYLIYSRSRLISTLVSSKVYRQLEFQAVGSWWIFRSADTLPEEQSAFAPCTLYRVPSSREDVFADDLITVKSKRTLMRFLRHISESMQQAELSSEAEEEDLSVPFPDYLSSKFKVPAELHDPLLSLSLSQRSPNQTPASFAIPRIQRHLSSIGVFGAGFGSLLTKWGGASEIAQVGCRALAVGGGVYVLNSGIRSISDPSSEKADGDARLALQLTNGEAITTQFVVGSDTDLPLPPPNRSGCHKVARSIAVVSSSLGILFPATSEGGPISAGAVVAFPGHALADDLLDAPPVFLVVHSSETGECPAGQSVVYGSVSVPGSRGQALIQAAISKLLQSLCGNDSDARVLWCLKYTQLGLYDQVLDIRQAVQSTTFPHRVFSFPPPSVDLAFDDQILDLVKEVWAQIMGDEAADHEFMNFADREGAGDENED